MEYSYIFLACVLCCCRLRFDWRFYVVVVVVQVQVTTCGTAKVAKSSYFASHLNERPPALGYRSETIVSKDVSHDVCKKNYSTQRKKSKWLAQLYTRLLVKSLSNSLWVAWKGKQDKHTWGGIVQTEPSTKSKGWALPLLRDGFAMFEKRHMTSCLSRQRG